MVLDDTLPKIMKTVRRLIIPLFIVCLLGAGCTPSIQSPKTAQSLDTYVNQDIIPPKNGFGSLPSISAPKSRVTVKLSAPIPDLPTAITVLRLRRGAPSDTELLNLTAAIGLPGAILGNRQTQRELLLNWTDDKQFHWTYNAAQRSLEFVDQRAPSGPLTVSTLPPNTTIVAVANDFLRARGVSFQGYRQPVVVPDWNQWWTNAENEQRCMDSGALAAVRAIGASAGLLQGTPPPVPKAIAVSCVNPEFPARLMVHYHMLVDGRDVVKNDGTYVNGAEILVDISRNAIVSGHITLAADPDRSDYPALTKSQVQEALNQGGLAGTSGDIVITGYDIASLWVPDVTSPTPATYLIPSLIAGGIRQRADGKQENIRIVVPLLAR
jgi:hypothetical protein